MSAKKQKEEDYGNYSTPAPWDVCKTKREAWDKAYQSAERLASTQLEYYNRKFDEEINKLKEQHSKQLQEIRLNLIKFICNATSDIGMTLTQISKLL